MNKAYQLFIVFLFGLMVFQAKAQSSVGFKGGVNFSQSNITQPRGGVQMDMDFVMGNAYGLIFKYVEKGIAGIQLELNYNQKGYLETERNGTASNMLLTETIELPFMTHIMLGRNNTKFIINLGPYFGYLIGSKNYVNENLVRASQENSNKYEFGILFGMGLLQQTPIGSFQLETRFSHALTDIYQFNNQDGLRGSQYQVLNVYLAYLIHTKSFKKKNK